MFLWEAHGTGTKRSLSSYINMCFALLPLYWCMELNTVVHLREGAAGLQSPPRPNQNLNITEFLNATI
jgi:hypothetical protein